MIMWKSIFSSSELEVLQKCCRIKTIQFWHFSISKKAQLPAKGITEQPLLLTKSKIKRLGHKF